MAITNILFVFQIYSLIVSIINYAILIMTILIIHLISKFRIFVIIKSNEQITKYILLLTIIFFNDLVVK